MRTFSTHICVCVILLIAAFYGSNFFSLPVSNPSSAAGVKTQISTPSAEVKLYTVTCYPQSGKNSKPKAASSVTRNIETAYAAAGAEFNFFNHSAELQHYINTL